MKRLPKQESFSLRQASKEDNLDIALPRIVLVYFLWYVPVLIENNHVLFNEDVFLRPFFAPKHNSFGSFSFLFKIQGSCRVMGESLKKNLASLGQRGLFTLQLPVIMHDVAHLVQRDASSVLRNKNRSGEWKGDGLGKTKNVFGKTLLRQY